MPGSFKKHQRHTIFWISVSDLIEQHLRFLNLSSKEGIDPCLQDVVRCQLLISPVGRIRIKNLVDIQSLIFATHDGLVHAADLYQFRRYQAVVTLFADQEPGTINLRKLLEAGCGIDGVSDHGTLNALASPNRAKHQRTRVESNAHA